ncbi:MAG: type II toxin-antitoxin system prevent-host-death family antitoxin [Anaerolineae bacterium]|nr:type II toxin-antitoxin system prevent-host-death family antitoxin [Anaerolineae bacterium]
MLVEIINLETEAPGLPEVTDRAAEGETIVVTRNGHELAVVIGIEEYRRLQDLVRAQDEHDFGVLLAPSESDEMSEEEAIELAVQVSRDVRAERSRGNRG